MNNLIVKIPPHGDNRMSLSGTEYLVAVSTRTARPASAFVAGDRISVLVFLAPKSYLFFLGALDPSLAHFDVILYFSLRELAVFPEYYVETESEYA